MPDDFVHDVARALDVVADDATRQWWERYMSGDASFRGVKMGETRRIVNELVPVCQADMRHLR